MRTEEERNEAIARLQENKTKTSVYTGLGFNKHEAIDAMIDVISNNYSAIEVENKYPIPSSEDIKDDYASWHALDASLWLQKVEGRTNIDDLLYPED